MRIPKIWRRFEGDVQKPDGGELHVFAWGWSESSTSEADAKARERFQQMQQRVSQGLDLPKGYGYGSRPVREQILREIMGSDGQVAALLTRNGYGSVVLNAARAMFIDVDAPASGGVAGAVGGLAKLLGFGSGGSAPAADAGLDQVRRALTSSGIGSARLYRTAGGFRLLATDRTFTPGSSEADAAMRSVGADPQFVQLCKIQDSFRARLTPKPWRVGHSGPPGDFPREDAGVQQMFDEWLQTYDRVAASKATCQFVETIGSSSVHPDVAPILALHDEQTKATSSLPLA
jgi:hypothetical protein